MKSLLALTLLCAASAGATEITFHWNDPADNAIGYGWLQYADGYSTLGLAQIQSFQFVITAPDETLTFDGLASVDLAMLNNAPIGGEITTTSALVDGTETRGSDTFTMQRETGGIWDGSTLSGLDGQVDLSDSPEPRWIAGLGILAICMMVIGMRCEWYKDELMKRQFE